jgi:hypothetical protein
MKRRSTEGSPAAVGARSTAELATMAVPSAAGSGQTMRSWKMRSQRLRTDLNEAGGGSDHSGDSLGDLPELSVPGTADRSYDDLVASTKSAQATGTIGRSRGGTLRKSNTGLFAPPSGGTDLPKFVVLAVSVLDDVGLNQKIWFDSGDAEGAEKLRAAVEAAGLSELPALSKDREVLARLFKQYFLELPEPLLTHHLRDSFLLAMSIEDDDVMLRELRTLTRELPLAYFNLVKFLLRFFDRLQTSADDADYARERLVYSFAPAFLRAPRPTDVSKEAARVVLATLVSRHNEIVEDDGPSAVFSLVGRIHGAPGLDAGGLSGDAGTGDPTEPEEPRYMLSSGTRAHLLAKLVSPTYRDAEFERTFLYTHNAWVPTADLIQSLVDHYVACVSGEPPVLEWKLRSAARVLGFFRLLVSDRRRSFKRDPIALSLLTDFCSRPEPESPDAPERSLARDLNRLVDTMNTLFPPEDDGDDDAATSTDSGSYESYSTDDEDDEDEDEENDEEDEEEEEGEDDDDDDGDGDDDDDGEEGEDEEEVEAAAAAASDITVRAGRASLLLVRDQTKRSHRTSAAASRTFNLVSSLSIWTKYSVNDIAKALTILDFSLFTKIQPEECLHKAFERVEESPNFSGMTRRFNNVSAWIVSEVVHREKTADRVQLVSKIIDIADLCLKLRNFNSVFALVAGLNGAPVSRLKKTWAKVPPKLMARYDKLLSVAGMERNYGLYRSILGTSKPPVVPYMGLVSKFLFAVEDGNPDLIAAPSRVSTAEGEKWVNFTKMRMVGTLIAQLVSYQQDPYAFQSPSELLEYLTRLPLVDEKVAYEISLRVEPRQASSSTT